MRMLVQLCRYWGWLGSYHNAQTALNSPKNADIETRATRSSSSRGGMGYHVFQQTLCPQPRNGHLHRLQCGRGAPCRGAHVPDATSLGISLPRARTGTGKAVVTGLDTVCSCVLVLDVYSLPTIRLKRDVRATCGESIASATPNCWRELDAGRHHRSARHMLRGTCG